MNEASESLIDIIEPVAPEIVAGTNWLWVAILLTVLVTMVIGLWMLWKRKWPAYCALKRLNRLQQQSLAEKFPPYETVILLAQELQLSLRLKRLQWQVAPSILLQQDQDLWQGLIQQLDAMRYQTGVEMGEAKLAEIFTQTETLLRHYSR
jgi:hypothetical protein